MYHSRFKKIILIEIYNKIIDFIVIIVCIIQKHFKC